MEWISIELVQDDPGISWSGYGFCTVGGILDNGDDAEGPSSRTVDCQSSREYNVLVGYTCNLPCHLFSLKIWLQFLRERFCQFPKEWFKIFQ